MEQSETLILGAGAAAHRSRRSMSDVFNASYRRLVVQMYGVVGDAAEAEDLVQEAFVRASAAGNRFLDVGNPEAWLRTAAVNLHRSRWRRKRIQTRLRPPPQPVDLPGLDEHVEVIDALRRLPAQQREVLALYYLADLDVAGVAETLRIPEGTVKSRLSRAREALAAQLERSPAMSEQLKEFRSRAEQLVDLPDLASLERRGHRLRTRRRAAAAVALAAVATITGLLATTAGRPHAEGPAKDPDQHATPYPGSIPNPPPLSAGTYAIPLSPDLTRPTVRVTVPRGWRAWIGPDRQAGRHGFVGVLALDVNKVTTEPCQPFEWGMKDIGRTRQDLVDALVALPRSVVTRPPAPDDRFGFPATHLRLRATDGGECRNGERFWVMSTDTGLVDSAGPGAMSDVWVVDVGARPALIAATWNGDTPKWAMRQLHDVVSSIRFDLPEG